MSKSSKSLKDEQVGRKADWPVDEQAVAVPIERVPAMLGVGRTSVFALCREGKLESRKVGRSRIVTMRSIRALAHNEAA